MTKIDFEFETEYGKYRDALYLSEEEEATLTEQQIEDIKQARLANWVAVVSAPPSEPLPEEVVVEEVVETPVEEVVATDPPSEEVVETPV